jgi:hypothetical protein
MEVHHIIKVDSCKHKCNYVRFEAFTAVTMKKVVFWDVALCRSCINRCFGGKYRHISPPLTDTLPLIHIPLLPAVKLHHRPHTSPLCCIPMCHTLPLSLLLYSWLFLTGGSVCSHLLTLVYRLRIFLTWRWRRYVPPKRRLMQDLHSATSQKTTFFISVSAPVSMCHVIKPLSEVRLHDHGVCARNQVLSVLLSQAE